eukprot:COSAG02_NODE_2551_length_8553_cov_102.765673_1_plen_57_part_00
MCSQAPVDTEKSAATTGRKGPACCVVLLLEVVLVLVGSGRSVLACRVELGGEAGLG